jgi:hypothetical protein
MKIDNRLVNIIHPLQGRITEDDIKLAQQEH